MYANPVVGKSSEESEYVANEADVTEYLTVGGASPLHDFSTQSWKEDLVLTVEGKPLYVAGFALALVSPVFETKLETIFKESGSRTRQLEIQDHSYDDFVEFLRCIYPTILKKVTRGNVMIVLPLAYEYDVEHIKKTCEQILISNVNEITPANEICKYINIAFIYQLDSLNDACERFALKTTWNELASADEFKAMPLRRKTVLQRKQIELLTSKLETAQDRNALFAKLVRSFWAGSSQKSQNGEIGLLLLTIPVNTDVKSFDGERVRINGHMFYTSCNKLKTQEYPEQYHFFVELKPLTRISQWSCKVKIIFRVLNQNRGSGHILEESTVEFTQTMSRHKVHVEKADRINDQTEGFNVDGHFTTEAFLLVDSTHKRAK